LLYLLVWLKFKSNFFCGKIWKINNSYTLLWFSATRFYWANMYIDARKNIWLCSTLKPSIGNEQTNSNIWQAARAVFILRNKFNRNSLAEFSKTDEACLFISKNFYKFFIVIFMFILETQMVIKNPLHKFKQGEILWC